MVLPNGVSVSKSPHFEMLPNNLIEQVKRSIWAQVQPSTKGDEIKKFSESLIETHGTLLRRSCGKHRNSRFR